MSEVTTATPHSAPSFSDDGREGNTPGSAATASSVGSFILSPLPLPTPQTVVASKAEQSSTSSSTAGNSNIKRRTNGRRTPATVQLERLLQPTPANATPAAPLVQRGGATPSPTAISTPRPSSSTTPLVIVPATPSPYTIDQFLQQSGLPPNLSRTATNIVFKVLTVILAIIDVIIGYAVNQFKVWWRKVISKKFPNAADILEALLEYTVEVCQFTAKVVKFLSPYIVWLIQTFIAIVLFIGGSFVCGIIILSKGRDAAENSHAGEVQSSAMKSLNLSIQNSPFYSRKAVPFTPRFVSNNDERVDAPIVVNQTAAAAASSGNGVGRRVQGTASFKSPPVGGQMAPISVMRRNSSLKSNQNTPTVVATKPTPNTRRVLFSESEHGEVDTEQFFYDKTLPASVRKVGRVNNENRQQQQQQMMIIMADETQNDTPNKTTSPTMASTTTTVVENKILRPSSFGPRASSTDNRSQNKNTSQVAAAATTNQPSTAVKKQQAEQEEQSKQQYIEKYGLLPTITPLSKRYGRMKRQQQQSLAIALSTIPANKTTGTNNVNAKRKRREIVGAASRMGRRRLNNFRANGSALPVVMLGKNTPTKRRREDEQNRADEWVWRAMNSDGEKENLNSQGEGTATKRAKVTNDGGGPQEVLPSGLSTPPKSINKSFSSVTTPPKTPGPSTFSLGSSTPAPKGNKDSSIGATPAKPSMPSFTFNDTSSSSGGGFSFGTSSGDAATDAKSNNKDDNVKTQDNVPTFSFGGTGASKPTEQNETIAPSFSFGVGGDAANSDDAKASASAKLDDQKEAATSFTFGAAGTTTSKDGKDIEQRQSFAFGASSTPAPTTAQDSSTKAPFSFGSKTNTPAASDTPSEIKQAPSFAFGSTSTPAQDSTTKPSFSFGSTGQAKPSTSQAPAAAATPAPAATGFAFGAANQTPAAAATNEASSSGFSFGAANQTPAASTTAATAGETKQAPSFSFGGTAAPAPNQTPTTAPSVPASSFSFGSTTATAPTTGATPASTFAFGGQTPGGAGGGVTNSFTVGGSGASARRRAKAAGRRK